MHQWSDVTLEHALEVLDWLESQGRRADLVELESGLYLVQEVAGPGGAELPPAPGGVPAAVDYPAEAAARDCPKARPRLRPGC
jgi:hypothetical protein